MDWVFQPVQVLNSHIEPLLEEGANTSIVALVDLFFTTAKQSIINAIKIEHCDIDLVIVFTGREWSSGKNADYFSSVEGPCSRRNFKTKRLNVIE